MHCLFLCCFLKQRFSHKIPLLRQHFAFKCLRILIQFAKVYKHFRKHCILVADLGLRWLGTHEKTFFSISFQRIMTHILAAQYRNVRNLQWYSWQFRYKVFWIPLPILDTSQNLSRDSPCYTSTRSMSFMIWVVVRTEREQRLQIGDIF